MFGVRRSIRYLVWFTTLITSFLIIPTIGYACSPALPDPWFTERITPIPAELPLGVGVRVIQMTRYDITRDYVEITNSSPTALYIIGTPWTANTAFERVPLTLPPGVGPTHKIERQQAVTWRPIFDTPQSQARMGWTQETSERKDAVLLEIHHNTLQSDQADVIDLASRNHTGDNRPTDVRLPDPQMVTFPLIYGTQLVEVPITISYVLNPTYKPDSVARSLNACRSSLFPAVALGMVAALVIIIAGVVSLRYWRRRHYSEKDTAA
jgi:hypothetical protein